VLAVVVKALARSRVMFRETTANRASLQRSGGGAGAMMKGIDPRLMQTVPLSKQDTKGNSFLRLCNLLSWSTILAATFAVVLDVILLLVVGIEVSEKLTQRERRQRIQKQGVTCSPGSGFGRLLGASSSQGRASEGVSSLGGQEDATEAGLWAG
ncbi:unnamed protein product, partial [Ectocarpus sp. 12 AP-2014]